ncbi:UNVERIFIED_CONTAM: cytochrome [Sesamum angustifolium]|uniref:Cytochrome n=1 Tax=Sesamum angustifolium TaxID=2727405 RepID=A0AAW2JZY9_9LAMI
MRASASEQQKGPVFSSCQRRRDVGYDCQDQAIGSSSSAVDLSDVLVTTTNDVFCRVALGRKYGDEDGEGRKFKKFLGEFVELLGMSSVGDYIRGWLGLVRSMVWMPKWKELLNCSMSFGGCASRT